MAQRALHVLKLAAPLDVITRRQRDLAAHFLLEFRHEPAQVAILYVHADDDAALGGVAVDLRWALKHSDVGQAPQRNLRAGRRVQEDLTDRGEVAAIALRQTHDGLK